MIGATVRVTVHREVMRAQLARDSTKLVDQVTAALVLRSRELAPIDTGDLRRSIRSEDARMVRPTRATGRVVAWAAYARFQHEGTGLYGPRRARIRPKRAKVLRFYWKKVRAVVFTPSVRGSPATKFMVRAMQEVLSVPPWKIVYFTRTR